MNSYEMRFEVKFFPSPHGTLVDLCDLETAKSFLTIRVDSPSFDGVVTEEIGRVALASIRKAIKQ